ncbi:MAG: TRAP transporter small permease [Rhodospirillales bacterium]|jgi:TRAP-type C4-dicarboxylate transport system permease small subunit
MKSSNERFDDNRGMGLFVRRMALAGGFVLVFISAITVVSVFGRYVLGAPITGDYEIVEFGVSLAVFAFFPYTHASNNNIVAGFFTSGLSKNVQNIMDMFQNIIFLVVVCLLAYTAIIGGIDKFNSNEISMFLSLQIWWLHAFGVVGLTLLGWVTFRKIIKWEVS